MPWQGSTFARLYSWAADKANGINITASRMDGEANDFAQGIAQTLRRDGGNAATAPLDAGGFRVRNVGAPTTAGDAVALGADGRLPALDASNLLQVTPADASVVFAKLAAGLVATQALAQEGLSNETLMTPLRVAQRIDVKTANQTQAEAGSDVTLLMTALRVAQYVTARLASAGQAAAGTDNTTLMTALRTFQAISASPLPAGFTSSEIAVPSTGSATTPAAHGLGGTPRAFACWLLCKSTDEGWQAGDMVPASMTNGLNGSGRGIAPWASASNVGAVVASGGALSLPNKSTGSVSSITTSSWRLVFQAWR